MPNSTALASATVTVAGTVLGFQIDTGDAAGCPLAARFSENVFATPDALAVNVAVSLLVTCPTFALKVAVAFPDGTVTLEGTATLELFVERLTGTPLLGAEALSVTVHDVDAGPVTVPGLHERLVGVMVVPPPPPLLVTDKPLAVADTGIELPLAPAANPDKVIGIVLLDVVLETVNVMVATVPALKTLSFSPYTVQTAPPVLLLQETVFPAPVGEEPSATFAPVISAPE